MIAFVGDERHKHIQYSADEEEEEEEEEEDEEYENHNDLPVTGSNNQQSDNDEEEDQFFARPPSSSQPSLTPTPQTPIEEPRAGQSTGDQSAVSNIHLANIIYETTSELDSHRLTSGGPALVCISAKTATDESDEVEGVDDELEVESETSAVVNDEYLSDPDFHDERPGKKDPVVSEGEFLTRRYRLERQLVVSGERSEEEEEQGEQVSQPASIPDHGYNKEINQNSETCAAIELEDNKESLSDENDKEPLQLEPVEYKLDQDQVSVESNETQLTIRCRQNNSQQDEINSGHNNRETKIDIIADIVTDQTGDGQESCVSKESSATINSTPKTAIELIEYQDQSDQPGNSVNRPEELVESECPVTASEANAEFFVDESTLAEDICASFKLDTFGLRPSEVHNTPTVDEQSGDDEDEATLNEYNSGSRFSERQESLDDVQSEVLDITPELSAEDRLIDKSRSEGDRSDEDGEKEPRTMLMELVNEYCDKLVELIKEEALKQVEQISSAPKGSSPKQMNILHVLQIESTSAMETKPVAVSSDAIDSPDNTAQPKSSPAKTFSTEKKVYTSSMYYDNEREPFPTIQQQLERSRVIAQKLEGDDTREDASSLTREPLDSPIASSSVDTCAENELRRDEDERKIKPERASLMFRHRRDRMQRFTLESSSQDSLADAAELPSNIQMMTTSRPRRASLEPAHLVATRRRLQIDNKQELDDAPYDSLDSDPANMTDTEYEAPRLRRRPLPARATTTPFRGRSKRLVEVDAGDSSSAGTATTLSRTKFKPFLDSSTLKDIERLREWSPYGDFNEHNSVSPELCMRLVQDLKGGSATAIPLAAAQVPMVVVQPAPCDTTNKEEDVGAPAIQDRGKATLNPVAMGLIGRNNNRGVQLFERRQLQSSDWIVSSSSPEINHDETPTKLTSSSEEQTKTDGIQDETTLAENTTGELLATGANELSRSASLLSRPSLSEETVMVADENSGEQVVELAPVVMSHAQPQLELATITRTPSFSASSWRVIECDSPDLLTSHTDGEETQEDENDDNMEEIQNAPHIDDVDDANANDMVGSKFEASGEGNKPGEKLTATEQGVSKQSQSTDADSLESMQANSLHRSWKVEGSNFDVVGGGELANRRRRRSLDWSPIHERDEDSGMGPPMATTTARVVRSQSRSSEIHQATLMNWRPRITTPTWMMAETGEELREEGGEYFDYDDSNSMEQNSDQFSLVTGQEDYQDKVNEWRRQQRLKRPSVASLRANYQNLVDESSRNTYRSYRYPFADLEQERNRRAQSCSLLDRQGDLEDSFTRFRHSIDLEQRSQDHDQFSRESQEMRAHFNDEYYSSRVKAKQSTGTVRNPPPPYEIRTLREEDEEENYERGAHFCGSRGFSPAKYNNMSSCSSGFSRSDIESKPIGRYYVQNDSHRTATSDFQCDQNGQNGVTGGGFMAADWRWKRQPETGQGQLVRAVQMARDDERLQLASPGGSRGHLCVCRHGKRILIDDGHDYGRVEDHSSGRPHANEPISGRLSAQGSGFSAVVEQASDGPEVVSGRCSVRVCIRLPHNRAHRVIIYQRPRVTYAIQVEHRSGADEPLPDANRSRAAPGRRR